MNNIRTSYEYLFVPFSLLVSYQGRVSVVLSLILFAVLFLSYYLSNLNFVVYLVVRPFPNRHQTLFSCRNLTYLLLLSFCPFYPQPPSASYFHLIGIETGCWTSPVGVQPKELLQSFSWHLPLLSLTVRYPRPPDLSRVV